ncbi:IS1634 family transposase [Lentisphaera profundi]|uniref:IS1634 family transposase n=1 Tax=Lentisphaera profundi TaxID=1658616 RepID=A0ABY7VYA6_9BACT|nr:IS1634 family transposase [Lentisphaera profundi]WDE97048.1 IS1634 family transposase [Lentisphaera profundi]
MYLETIKSKRNGKIYVSHLVRETFREDGKIKHRTLSNVSKLPPAQLLALKNSLKGKKGDFNLEDLRHGRSYEFGASYVFMELAKNLGLDKMIFSQKTQCREDVLAMIVGRLVYQGSKLSLTNMYQDTFLWALAGHELGVRPDVEAHCYKPMDELLERKDKIERKLSKKHLEDGCMVLYDMTNTWFEGKYEDSDLVAFGKPKGGKVGYKQIAIGLLTDKKGCPVGVEIFKGSTSDQTTVLGEVKKLSEKYGLKNLIFTGDRGMLTPKRIAEVNEIDYSTITALTHSQIKTLHEKDNIQMELFDSRSILEVMDDDNKNIRYMLCKNENTMRDENATRRALIAKIEKELTQKSSVKQKRQRVRVAASVGRLFERCKVEKFFQWDVDDNGKLTWSLNEEKVKQEEKFDGCYIIRTDAPKENIGKDETVLAYRDLQKVEQAFRNLKTVSLELRPMHHKTDERLKSHIFLSTLAYYIQWNATQLLKLLFDEDGKYKEKRWTFQHVVERLKSIRITENLIDGVVVKKEVSQPDEEQQKILNLLGVKLK